MKINITKQEKKEFVRTYPCLLSINNDIALALNSTDGFIISTNRPGISVGDSVSFRTDGWVDYFGVVTLDSRLEDNAREQSGERRLDATL